MWRNATGLLTRGSLLRRLPGPETSGAWRGASPLTAAGPSRTCTGFPHRVPFVGRAYHRAVSGSLQRWLPVVVWAAVIFALSSVPDLGTGLGGWDTVLRKIAHAGEYAVLGALLLHATRRSGLAFAVGTLYAMSDEIHQSFVTGRHGSPVDVAIDAVGVACGIVLWQQIRARSVA
jgi:VanZ family protein